VSDLLDENDELEREDDDEGASILGGGGPAATLDDDAGLDDADYHGDRLAGGDPDDRD
jgi:hypothetical protein